ncbi:MAG: hypothetical protein A2Y74_01515 [Actinobacteria bacterium RBG_13_63_9]|nr:MAG: hypothetical protein A2Y74_01515 [Actinobacteria bacterium RBG_13_63_9]
MKGFTMIYEFPLTVETAHLVGSPVEEEVKLTHGVVHRVEVEFPAGCVGLVHVAIDHFAHQAWPANPSGSFASDDYVVAFDDYLPLLTPPYKLKLRGWTEGTSYDHTVKVRIGLLPESIAKKRFGTLSEADSKRMRQTLLSELTGVEGL